MNPSFKVPAEYFYALAAGMPESVDADMRYHQATVQSKEVNFKAINKAIASGLISGTLPINPAQGARRLVGLGFKAGTAAVVPLGSNSAAKTLVTDWLNFQGDWAGSQVEDIELFWGPAVTAGTGIGLSGQLELVLAAITENQAPLIAAIKAIPVTNVDQLAARTEADWRSFFDAGNVAKLSPQLLPGASDDERVTAFLHVLKQYFEIAPFELPAPQPASETVPGLGLPPADLLGAFAAAYQSQTGQALDLSGAVSAATVATVAAQVSGGDACAREWLIATIQSLQDLAKVADVTGVDASLKFSIMEALYARGYTSNKSIAAVPSPEEFAQSLTGTVAYDFAAELFKNAGGKVQPPEPAKGGFRPINPDGLLTDCVPPAELSPFGPVAYLSDLLKVSANSTCKRPFLDFAPGANPGLGSTLTTRRGPLATLDVTAANLRTPIPLVDMVNECLESMVTNGTSQGVVYNTATASLAGYSLVQPGGHDATTLFGAIPEHSSPAAVIQAAEAYETLSADFSSPVLPYSQPLDVNRTYLGHLCTNRFQTMRTFRKQITEFVQNPGKEPTTFQSHLWRFPVRIDIAIEYLGISADEYGTIYSNSTKAPDVATLFGLKADAQGLWIEQATSLAVLLKGLGLSYCEFLELWKCGLVPFARKAIDGQPGEFPDCEPCCPADYRIQIDKEVAINLGKLAIFVRLWRTLNRSSRSKFSLDQFRDICDVLGLFTSAGKVNTEFIRQLAAFQMLRDEFCLPLIDTKATIGSASKGADRTHLLALWVPKHSKRDWALEQLLNQVAHFAQKRHRCGCRPPEFVKILKANLAPLAKLAGTDPWDKAPTFTIRLAEILAKVYASRFTIGEIFFLFTNDDHVDGDDPLLIPSDDEIVESPLEFPDDDQRFSLWDLRKKLLAVNVTEEESSGLSWTAIDASLRDDFGYRPAGTTDPLVDFGKHFFPGILDYEAIAVAPNETRYRVPLPSQSAAMWNTPPDGPFRYDPSGTGTLWAKLPLGDQAVLNKLSRIRQLNANELKAVRDLYFAPRAELAQFSFLFPNLAEADECLIQESDETRRWSYFQKAFAVFRQRCRVIAAHLAAHVAGDSCAKDDSDKAVAWQILRSLFADENFAKSPWEVDSGATPAVTWGLNPQGGAFAALLGLVGTGLVGEYRFLGSNAVVWRELRGGLSAFGPTRNHWNCPVPGIVPAMDFSLPTAAQQFVSVRNGIGLANSNAEILGGLQGYSVTWRGSLLVDEEGPYRFWAGVPEEGAEVPGCPTSCNSRWRVVVRRLQKTWVVSSHHWGGSHETISCPDPICLKPGVYQLEVEFEQPQPEFHEPEDVCPQHTGFGVRYQGPDTGNCIAPIPFDRLFIDRKTQRLSAKLNVSGKAGEFLDGFYTSSLRDILRTYARAFKAILFANRLALSGARIADDGQSELGYMLSKPDRFAGASYYTSSNTFTQHLAGFDFNFLALEEFFPSNFDYSPPNTVQDDRARPVTQLPIARWARRQALFDWWERLFDYTQMRAATDVAPERPVWLLFHEAAENHTNPADQLLRHMGVDASHRDVVLRYFDGYTVSSPDLMDDRWAIRVWHSERLLDWVLCKFCVKDIRYARPDLWAATEPGELPATVPPTPAINESGNQNLMRFVYDGSLEQGEPRRYKHIQSKNDGLRERARKALVAYLCAMNRVPLQGGGFAKSAKDLSEILLLDVEAGLCERASRIEQAASSVQLFVQRARLGLEPGFPIKAAFVDAWDKHFASFRTWESCKSREIYKENWIEFGELETARRSESFRFLEDQLRRASLTIPAPGGTVFWPPKALPAHSGVDLAQGQQPSSLAIIPKTEGLELAGLPERDGRLTWLSASQSSNPSPVAGVPGQLQAIDKCRPTWIEAAIRMGARFVRVAAAGVPQAGQGFCETEHTGCCAQCGQQHEPTVDEYYFWLMDTRHFEAQLQDVAWKWHDQAELPKLLDWQSKPMVHLFWSRVHNGEFQQPRRSADGVKLKGSTAAKLLFKGRSGDSLRFEVVDGDPPIGHATTPPAGFRYDLAPDVAITVPKVVADIPPSPVFGLAAYPFFAYFQPGAPIYPDSCFGPALVVGDYLRSHCRHEEALGWYRRAYSPLERDNRWAKCLPRLDLDNEHLGHKKVPGQIEQLSQCCDATIESEQGQRDRALTLRYLETILEWADSQSCRNTPEALEKARLILDTGRRILGSRPKRIAAVGSATPVQQIGTFKPVLAPLNPRLLSIYERVEARMANIHACLNGRKLKSGVLNKDVAFWGDSQLGDGWQGTANPCEENSCCAPCKPYRFVFLIQQAHQLAGEVRGFGSALLSAFEKGDAEYLASMRSVHERQMLSLATSVRKNQVRDAMWQRDALKKAKEIVQLNLQYYTDLINAGLISAEQDYESFESASRNLRLVANGVEAAFQAMNLSPDAHVGSVSFAKLPTGSKVAHFGQAIARAALALADYWSSYASRRLTQAGWDRRLQEWNHQKDVLEIEVIKAEMEICAAERRLDNASIELNNHQRQLENSEEVLDFLRDKFTNHALYLWMQRETAALYRQSYELALHTARTAQRAFNVERGFTNRSFLPNGAWDNLHEGLLAGDRLQLALREMEKAYYDENCREYELAKHISMRLHFPTQFLELKATGRCIVEIPEWLFNQDYPSHFMRRIKSVSVSIPCVTGPYVGVHCRLTLLSSATRIDPRLRDARNSCCKDERQHCGCGYEAAADDPRIVKHYSAVEAVSTSSAQNDGGVFELSFRDERYLPFEYAGAVSRWRIELPQEQNQFDLDTVTDVVMHVNYMAREGGDVLGRAAMDCARAHLPGDGIRLFDVRQDFPGAWHAFQSKNKSCGAFELDLKFSRSMFPFIASGDCLKLSSMQILYEAACPVPSRCQTVEFIDAQAAKHCPPGVRCKPERVECVASEEWPRLFHGVLGVNGKLESGCDLHLGSLRVPEGHSVSRVYLLVGYERCSSEGDDCGCGPTPKC